MPRWNTANIYSGLEAEDYRGAFAQLERDLEALALAFDQRGIRRPSAAEAAALAAAPHGAIAGSLELALAGLNNLARLVGTLDSFVHAFLTTDSYNALAARETSRLEIIGTRREQLDVRLLGWLGAIGPRLPEIIAERPRSSRIVTICSTPLAAVDF